MMLFVDQGGTTGFRQRQGCAFRLCDCVILFLAAVRVAEMLPRSAPLFKTLMNVCLYDFTYKWVPKIARDDALLLYHVWVDQFGKGRSVSVINVPGNQLSIESVWRACLAVQIVNRCHAVRNRLSAFIELDNGTCNRGIIG